MSFLAVPAILILAAIFLPRTLSNLVFVVLAVAPVIFTLYEWRKGVQEESTPWLLRRLFVLVPAGLAVYFFNTNHQLFGMVSSLAYLALSSSIWGDIMVHFFPEAGHGDENVLRGSRVVDAATMNAEKKQSLTGQDITIGGVLIPRMVEAQHFLITGTTGSGKTQVINGILRGVRSRGHRAVIADPAGGFYSRFGLDNDIIFNPFDSRSVGWSPFAEIQADYDCERIAKAIVPDGVGDSAEWHHYAQTLIAKSMLAMHRNGERSIKRLLYWLTTADQKELGTLLAGTAAAALCAKGNDKMLASTRGIISTYIGVFDYLADEGSFSVRKWIREESWPQNWMFITYRDDQMGMLRTLVATILEMALVEGLSLSENQERGLWYVMDEVDSLGKVTSLRAALTKLRKYGGRCVLGLQTVSQLRTTYGKDEAQTLVANTSIKCILRAGDAETAKSMEGELGEQEIERVQVSVSDSSSRQGSSSGASTSSQVLRQSAVMASEIMGLPDLHGFLKLTGDAIASVQVDYVGMPEVRPAFVG